MESTNITETTTTTATQPTPLQQVRVHERIPASNIEAAPVAGGPGIAGAVNNVAAKAKESIHAAAATIENKFPAVTQEVNQLGRDLKGAVESKPVKSEERFGLYQENPTFGFSKDAPAVSQSVTTTASSALPAAQPQGSGFHIDTAGLPVEIHPVPTNILNAGLGLNGSQQSGNELDIATIPTSVDGSVTNVERVLDATGGADSRPSSLMAVQSGFGQSRTAEGLSSSTTTSTTSSMIAGLPLVDKANEAAAALAAKLPAVPEAVKNIGTSVAGQTESVPSVPLEKVGAMISASAAVLASGMSNLGHKVIESLPGVIQDVREAVPIVKAKAVEAANTASHLANEGIALAQETGETLRLKANEGIALAQETGETLRLKANEGLEFATEKANEGLEFATEKAHQTQAALHAGAAKVGEAVAPIGESINAAGVRAKETLSAIPVTINTNVVQPINANVVQPINAKVVQPVSESLSAAGAKASETALGVKEKAATLVGGKSAPSTTTTSSTTTTETRVEIENNVAAERAKAHQAVPLYRTDAEIAAEEASLGNKAAQAVDTVKAKAAIAAETVKDSTVHAVEVVKDKTALATEAVKEQTAIVADKAVHAKEVVKDKASLAADTVKDKSLQTASTVKETTQKATDAVVAKKDEVLHKDTVEETAKPAPISGAGLRTDEKVNSLVTTTIVQQEIKPVDKAVIASLPVENSPLKPTSAFTSIPTTGFPTLTMKSKAVNPNLQAPIERHGATVAASTADVTLLKPGSTALFPAVGSHIGPGLSGLAAGQPVTPPRDGDVQYPL